MQTKTDCREHEISFGIVLDSKVLDQLYKAREKVGGRQKLKIPSRFMQELKSLIGGSKGLMKGKQKVRLSSSSEGEYISNDLGQELDFWSNDIESNFDLESCITVASLLRTPTISQTGPILPTMCINSSLGSATSYPFLSSLLQSYVLRHRHFQEYSGSAPFPYNAPGQG